MRLTTNAIHAKRLIAKPNFKSFKIIIKDIVLVTLSKTEVVMNKPIAVGTAILDIAKQIVYDFHYNYVQKRFGVPPIVSETSDAQTGSGNPPKSYARLVFF